MAAPIFTANLVFFHRFTEAFDTIDHTLLLQKLSCCSTKGHILSWFKSDLDNRTQHVLYNSVNSKHMTVRCGVSQDSILGSLLFILYISDLCNT